MKHIRCPGQIQPLPSRFQAQEKDIGLVTGLKGLHSGFARSRCRGAVQSVIRQSMLHTGFLHQIQKAGEL